LKRAKRESDQVIELNQWAMTWWEDQLNSKSAPAQAAREYLEQRGITEETQKTFRLGLLQTLLDCSVDPIPEMSDKTSQRSGSKAQPKSFLRLFGECHAVQILARRLRRR